MDRTRQARSRSRVDSKRNSLAKRLSLSALSTGTPNATTTTLYITYTAELRGDQDVYMFGIDRCYDQVEEANARIELLGTCNVNLKSVETKLLHVDTDTGCLTVTWGRYGSPVRFVAVAKKVEMPGEVMEKTKEETSPGGWDKDSEIGLFFAESHLDLAGHVWAVAIHNPGKPITDNIITLGWRQSQHGRESSMSTHSRRSSLNTKKLLDSVTEMSPITPVNEERYTNLGWSFHSLHANSDKALACAKRAWNEHFKAEGRCKKVREHYGFARYALKPATFAPKKASDYETCLQIRIERVKVMTEGEMLSEFSMLQVVPPKVIIGQPFPVSPIRNVNGEVISTAAGRRTSFLEDLYKIANEALDNDTFDYEDLPLAMRIRQEHMARWGSLSDMQRYGARETDPDTAADMYHAVVHKAGSELRGRRLKHKTPSQAYLKARARMAAAVAQDDEAEAEAGDRGSVTNHALRREARRLGNGKLNVPFQYARVPHVPKSQRDVNRLRRRSVSAPRADSVVRAKEAKQTSGLDSSQQEEHNTCIKNDKRRSTALDDVARRQTANDNWTPWI